MALGGALGPDLSPVTRLFAWQPWYLVALGGAAWSGFVARAALCVAGLAGEDHLLEPKKPMCLRP